MPINAESLSLLGAKLKERYTIFDIDICHEHYSATIDFGRELTDSQIADLKRQGFDVTHEESTVYTLQYES